MSLQKHGGIPFPVLETVGCVIHIIIIVFGRYLVKHRIDLLNKSRLDSLIRRYKTLRMGMIVIDYMKNVFELMILFFVITYPEFDWKNLWF